MANIKVSAVAKEYNVTPDKIIASLEEIGEQGYVKSQPIDDWTLKQLRKHLGEPPKKETKVVPKPAPKKLAKSSEKSSDKTAEIKNVANKTVDGETLDSKINSTKSSASVPKPAMPKPIPTPAPIPSGAASNVPAMSAIPTPAFAARAHENRLSGATTRSGNNPYAVANVPRTRQYGGARGGFNNRPGFNRQNAPGGAKPFKQGMGNQNGQYNGHNGQNNRFGQQNRPFGASGQNNGQRFNRPKPGLGILGAPSPFLRTSGGAKPGQKGAFTRPGQKGGAFGKQGSRAKYKRERTRNAEQDILEMPTIHGIVVPKGDGKTVIRLKQGASLTDFGEKIGANPANLVMILFNEFSQMITATQSLDEETLELLAVELGYNIEMVSEEDMDRELLEEFDIDLNAEESDETDLEIRPPVVTVMGHVDHGKTKLLDAIRNTNVIEQEKGGITQKIGAYQIHLEHEGVDRKITFIDTPGHEAFTAMRARGAEITDVAILVVAADDGVMPQTVEAINHAQAAGVPIVVAVNKIDKEGANPDKVRGQLTEYGIVAEDFGGDTMFVNISAVQGTGITELLDSVLLTVDAAMELKANKNMSARGSVIEARLDKGRGPVVSLLVQTGTIKVGDSIVAGRSYGKVRALSNESGKKLEEAYPSCPVRLLGLQSVPTAGDSFLVVDDDRTARQIAEKREAAHRAALLAKRRKRMSLEDFKDAVEAGKIDRMNLIIKGDTSGSIEALEDELIKIEEDALLNGEVGLNVIHRGVGDVTQNDINLATVDNAVIIAFNVKTSGMAGEIADAEGIEIKYYSIIYKVIEDIELALHGMLKPEYEESIMGYAEVRQIFKSSKAGTIAGSMVKGGEMKRGASARVFRDEKEISTDDKIAGLKRFKDDVTEVKEGFECGISLANFNELQEGDIIEIYEMVEKPRELPKRSDSGGQKVSKGKGVKSTK